MNEKKSFLSVKEMVEMALLLALAVVLDLAGIKIGHASFTMVPLFILVYRHGLIKSGVVIGIIYAFINMAFDSWSIDAITLIFDYVLGYGLMSLAALFAKKAFNQSSKHWMNIMWLSISIILCSLIRLVCSSISGVILEYAPTFFSAFWINLTLYIGWDCLLAFLSLIILYPSILLINKRFPTSFTKKFDR